MENEIFGEIFEIENEPEISSKKKNRILVKEKKIIDAQTTEGIVVTSKGRYFFVEDIFGNKQYKCIISGSIQVEHPHKSLVTVGDKVKITLHQAKKDGEQLGKIVFVDERKTFFVRKSIRGNFEDVIASNIEQVLIILSASNPPYNKRMLDKILISCEYGGCSPIICINKIDLVDEKEIISDLEIYEKIGYKVFLVSAKNGIGLEEIKKIINGSTTLFVGVSGVGKSTLVNKLYGKEIQKVGNLAKNLRGRHTTTSCVLFKFDEKTKIIDSPGFKEFDLYGISKENLQFYFPDFERYFQKCKFQPCSHTHEPGCAVKNAVHKKKISYDRYFSYLSIVENL